MTETHYTLTSASSDENW